MADQEIIARHGGADDAAPGSRRRRPPGAGPDPTPPTSSRMRPRRRSPDASSRSTATALIGRPEPDRRAERGGSAASSAAMCWRSSAPASVSPIAPTRSGPRCSLPDETHGHLFVFPRLRAQVAYALILDAQTAVRPATASPSPEPGRERDDAAGRTRARRDRRLAAAAADAGCGRQRARLTARSLRARPRACSPPRRWHSARSSARRWCRRAALAARRTGCAGRRHAGLASRIPTTIC